MPKINIVSLGKEVLFSDYTNTVFDILQQNKVDWMHACGTKGRCTTCRMIVLEGMHNISRQSKIEIAYQKNNMLNRNERLTCQCTLLGNINIAVPENCRLPHLNYID